MYNMAEYERQVYLHLEVYLPFLSYCKWGKVNLFTRPRRFGKTLNMSMLRYFFENEATAIPLALEGGLR